MKNETIEARKIEVGDQLLDVDGKRYHTVTHVKRGRAFKMGLEGHPDKFAVELTLKGHLGFCNLHPNTKVERKAGR